MAEKKYKVAENNSVVVKGVVLKSGEAIPAGAVSAEAIKRLVAAKLIVEDKDAKSEPPKDGGKKSGAGKDGGKDVGDKDADGAQGSDSGAGENAGANGEQGGGQA